MSESDCTVSVFLVSECTVSISWSVGYTGSVLMVLDFGNYPNSLVPTPYVLKTHYNKYL